MKKILLVLGLLIGLSSPIHAANCDAINVPGMPEATVIDLKKKCIDLQNSTKPVASVNELSEYAELGKKYGIALSEVAKSIGTTVNELAQTPVGKFMLVMVAYKVMGEGLIGVFGGILWFSTMIPLWIFMFYKLVFSTRRVVEITSPNDKSVKRTIDPVDYGGPAGPISVVMMFVMFAICISGFIMVF